MLLPRLLKSNTALETAILGVLSSTSGNNRRSAWTPAQWFLAGQDGAWLSAEPISNSFVDSSGYNTITATEQLIGLSLDKRLGLTLGNEIVTNGNMEAGVAPTIDWGAAIGSSGFNTTNPISGTQDYLVTITTSTTGLRPSFVWGGSPNLVTGRTYEASFRYKVVSGAPIIGSMYAGAGLHTVGQVLSGSGTITIRARAAGTLASCGIYFGNAVGAVQIDNLSMKELAGNHVIQATTAQKARMRLDGSNYYYSLDRVDDNLGAALGGGGTTGICVCATIRAGGAGNARTIWSDRGTNTGYRLSINASNQLVLSAGNGASHTEVVGPTVTAGTDYVVTGWHDGANLNVRLNAGAITSAAFGTATAGTAGFTVGRDNGGATEPFGDRIYELVYRKNDTSTAGDRSTLISYMAAQVGITL